MASNVNWLKIKNEYINGNISYRKLAEKYKVSLPTIAKRAKQEDWQSLRDGQYNKNCTKTIQKTAEKIVDLEVDRMLRINTLADDLAGRIEQAIGELDKAMVTNKTRTRVVEYNDDEARGKPTKEVIEDTEQLIEVASIVDRAGLKQLTAALKDIKDIQSSIKNQEATGAFVDILNAVQAVGDNNG